jgi:hypothetical protein
MGYMNSTGNGPRRDYTGGPPYWVLLVLWLGALAYFVSRLTW